jgi:hypothetical protein
MDLKPDADADAKPTPLGVWDFCVSSVEADAEPDADANDFVSVDYAVVFNIALRLTAQTPGKAEAASKTTLRLPAATNLKEYSYE